MKMRLFLLTLLLTLGVVRGSLKLITDSGMSLEGKTEAGQTSSGLKSTKRVGRGAQSRKLPVVKTTATAGDETDLKAQERKLQRRRPGAQRGRKRARRPGTLQSRLRAMRNRLRKAGMAPIGRPPRAEPRSANGRFVSDRILLEIHRRSLISTFADPRAGNVRQRPGTECDLYVEAEPMYYTTITRTTSSIMHFTSNCMPTQSVNIEAVYGRNRNINWAYHPRKVYLSILGNLYRVNYSRPRVIDRHDIIRSLRYSRARVLGTFNAPRSIRLSRRNSVYLAPQIRNSFTQAALRQRFNNLKGHWRCQTRPRRFSQYAMRIRRRRAMIARFRKQGFNTREIARMIRRNQFGPRVVGNMNVETPREVAGLPPLLQQGRRRRRRRQPRRARRARPRNLRVKEVGPQAAEASAQPNETVDKEPRKTQSISDRVSNEVRRFVRSPNASTANPRRRRRGRRPPRRRVRRTGRQQNQFEINEERQRLADRRFIRNRLNRNFISELVIVCTLR